MVPGQSTSVLTWHAPLTVVLWGEKGEHPRHKGQKEQGPPELVIHRVGHAIPNLVAPNKHRLLFPHTSILLCIVFNLFLFFFKSLTIMGKAVHG